MKNVSILDELRRRRGSRVRELLDEPALAELLAPRLQTVRAHWLAELLRRIPDERRVTVREAVESASLESDTIRAAVRDCLGKDPGLLDRVERAGLLDDPLSTETSFEAHPALIEVVDQLDLADRASSAGVPPDRLEAALDAGLTAANLDGPRLHGLVGAGILTREDAEAIGLATTLHASSGDDTIAGRLLNAVVPNGRSVRRIGDLAALSTEDIASLAGAAEVDPTALESIASSVRAALPFRAARARLSPSEASELESDASLARTLRWMSRMDAPVADVVAMFRSGARTPTALATTSSARLAREAGVARDVAETARRYALERVDRSLLRGGSIIDLIGAGRRSAFALGNDVAERLGDALREESSLGALIGANDHCRCDECRSLLSPAAYFVDLMRFVEGHVLDVAFEDESDPHHLRVRRPDLWQVSLSCERVREELPTLVIINDVLERYLSGDSDSAGPCGTETDAAPREEVYRDQLASSLAPGRATRGSVDAPFFLPLEAVDRSLEELGAPRSTLVERVDAPRPQRLAAYLQTSIAGVELVRTPRTDPAELERIYGSDASRFRPDPPDSAALAQRLRLPVEALREILLTRTVRGDDSPGPRLERLGSPQPNREVVAGLTNEALDRLHRFVRLVRHVPWTAVELDDFLSQWRSGRAATSWSDAIGESLDDLVAGLRARGEAGLSHDDLLAFMGALPTGASSDGTPGLLERRFSPELVARLGERFSHPTLSPASTQHEMAARLAAGCGIDSETLAALIERLQARLDASDDASRGFVLDLENLSRLYRHARLVELSGHPPRPLFRLLDVLGFESIEDLEEARTVLSASRWVRTRGLEWIERHTSFEPSASDRERVGTLRARIQSDGPHRFGASFFASVDGVNAAESERIVRELLRTPAPDDARSAPLPLLVRDGEDRLRLRAEVDLSVALPPDHLGLALPHEAALREALRPVHPRAVVREEIRRSLEVSAPRFESLLALAGDRARDHLPAAADEALGAGDAPSLRTLSATLSRLASVTRELSDEALDAIAASPDLVGPPTASLAWIDRVEALADALDGNPDASAVLATLRAHAGSRPFGGASDDDLAAATGADASFARAATELVAPARYAIDSWNRLRALLRTCRDLGLAPTSLAALTGSPGTPEEEFDQWATLAAVVRPRVDEAARERIDAELRGRRRDALRDHLLANEPERFSDVGDSHDYFLIDPELAGCHRTSCVVAATSALQIYVQRILLGLERWEGGGVEPSLVPEVEWSWRRRYRLWEANRKIFLHPENYLAAVDRDDRTPLFRELEDRLRGSDLSEQSVLDAFAAYARGLDELGRLRIAGSYHERDPIAGRDVLHLFGVSADSPPSLYYRQVEGLHRSETEEGIRPHYTAWTSVDVSLPSRVVTPVVGDGRLVFFWVDAQTRPETGFEGGSSTFRRYKHELRCSFATLRLDGSWSAPQELDLRDEAFVDGPGIIADPLRETVEGWVAELDRRASPQIHEPPDEPIDGFHLSDYRFDRVLPDTHGGTLRLSGLAFKLDARPVDLFTRRLGATSGAGEVPVPPVLSLGASAQWLHSVRRRWNHLLGPLLIELQWATVWSSNERFHLWARSAGVSSPGAWYQNLIADPESPLVIFDAPASLDPVGGAVSDAIVHVGREILHVMGGHSNASAYVVRRLGTRVTEPLGRALFRDGVDGLLSTRFQESLAEGNAPYELGTSELGVTERIVTDRLDFDGPFGIYFRELFLHAPFAIACQLHAAGRYRDAMRWLHFIVDPTSSTEDGPDRIWRYVEFRGRDEETLRDMLTKAETLAAHRDDPFNPHAIARTRLMAYQRAVAMKYLDVLFDLADDLFRRFQRDTIDEAHLLYLRIARLMGGEPTEIGDCLEGDVGDYVEIREHLGRAIDALLAKEDEDRERDDDGDSTLVLSPTLLREIEALQARGGERGLILGRGDWRLTPNFVDSEHGVPGGRDDRETAARAQRFALFAQIGVFCVPFNPRLREYFERVEDRLFKIRNCLDIDGRRRDLPLLSPPIDPTLLANARASGLSIDELTSALSRDVPPHRFSVLLERAKAHASTVASFGAQLRSAVERRDAEELTKLRSVHRQNLLRLARRSRELEIQAAERGLEAAINRRQSAEQRKGFVEGLLERGLNPFEELQHTRLREAGDHQHVALDLTIVAGIMHLVPQLGAPTAITYGGSQLGAAASAAAGVASISAGIKSNAAASAQVQASFARRKESWTQQAEVLAREVRHLETLEATAQLRLELATEALTQHEQAVEQAEEEHAFLAEKVGASRLYDWLASQLGALYHEAFRGALATAQLAERAFVFERHDAAERLSQDYWDEEHHGFLAGERLLVDLMHLEQRYLETDRRELEVTQTFPLSQFDPEQLWALREAGECEFTIPELLFDLAYPGQYRRRIRAVRLTIPAVVGPHTNVSAMLVLESSRIRWTADRTGEADVVPPPPTDAIATSTAQGDGGVFELRFDAGRYLPFEGAGAVQSRWTLSLPKELRAFDYRSISDVLVHLSYTARHDEGLREEVDSETGELFEWVRVTGMPRVISMRRELGATFRRLLDAELGTEVAFELESTHLPFLLRGHDTEVIEASIAVIGGTPTWEVSIDGSTARREADDPSTFVPLDLSRDATGTPRVWTVLGRHTIRRGVAEGGARPGLPEDILLQLVMRRKPSER